MAWQTKKIFNFFFPNRVLDSTVCFEKLQFFYLNHFQIKDPFDPDPDPTVDHKLKDNWGAMKWVDLDDIDLESGWLLMKGKNFKGYPFKASTFKRYPTMVASNGLPKSFLKTFYANGVKYSDGLAGFDGLVLGNLAQVYNFRTVRIASISYGATLPDGSFSGYLTITN